MEWQTGDEKTMPQHTKSKHQPIDITVSSMRLVEIDPTLSAVSHIQYYITRTTADRASYVCLIQMGFAPIV